MQVVFELLIIITFIYRDFHKAADAAFQDQSLAKLEEVQAKAGRHPELMEHVKTLKARLGYK